MIIKSNRVSICIILLSIIFFSSSFAQDKRFLISISGGMGYSPQNEFYDYLEFLSGLSIDDDGCCFIDFVGEHLYDLLAEHRKLDSFDTNERSKSLDLKMSYSLSNKSGLAFTAGYRSLSINGISAYNFYAIDINSSRDSWKFTSFPFSISFEHYPLGIDRKIFPLIGIGPTLNFNKIVTKRNGLKEFIFNDYSYQSLLSRTEDTDTNFGIQIYVGLHNDISERIFIKSLITAHYLEKSNIYDEENSRNVSINHNGVDFKFGLGIRL